MFSGIKELLIIVFVLLVLFLVPRMLRKRPSSQSNEKPSPEKVHSNTGLLRLGLLLSVLWVALAFILLNPFSGSWKPFGAGGLLPVALGWGFRWVAQGFK